MIPVRSEDATHILKPPRDWNDGDPDLGPCGELPVTKDGFQMKSRWRPSAAERELLANGGDVELVIVGVNHPVVAVGVIDPITGDLAA